MQWMMICSFLAPSDTGKNHCLKYIAGHMLGCMYVCMYVVM